MLFQGRRPSNK